MPTFAKRAGAYANIVRSFVKRAGSYAPAPIFTKKNAAYQFASGGAASVQGAPTTTLSNSTVASTTATMPAGIVAGEMLIAFVGTSATTGTFTAPGWNIIEGPTFGSYGRTAVMWKIADGSDTLVVGGFSARRAIAVYRVANATNVQHITAVPPSALVYDCPPLSPAAGEREYLFFAAAMGMLSTATVIWVSAPAGYENQAFAITTNGTGAGGAVAVASRSANTATEDPGSFSSNGNRVVVTWTVAVW